jgi:hypothetical protein
LELRARMRDLRLRMRDALERVFLTRTRYAEAERSTRERQAMLLEFAINDAPSEILWAAQVAMEEAMLREAEADRAVGRATAEALLAAREYERAWEWGI